MIRAIREGATTVAGLLCLPTRPLLCERCGAYTRWISPYARLVQALTGRTPCTCGGTLQAVKAL